MLMNGNDFSRHAVANTHPHNPVFRLQNFTFETDIWKGYSTLFGLIGQIHEVYLQPTFDKVYGFYTTDEAEKCTFLSRYNCNIYLELDTNSCH